MKSFIYKLRRFEFWPWWAIFIPVLPMYFVSVLWCRRLLYFTAVNPDIEMGGFFGEKKNEIMDLVPVAYRPLEVFVTSKDEPIELITESGLQFPVILKPNVGERGFQVLKAEDRNQLRAYHQKGFDYIIQEFLGHDEEYGVLFYHYGGETRITSLSRKEFMQVLGDGKSNVEELIKAHHRHFVYLNVIRVDYPELLEVIPAKGEWYTVHKIGNHVKGARFINCNHQISDKLLKAMSEVVDQMEGVALGRFDLKANSIEALEQGRFKIFELNGVSSEPGHIYDLSNVFLAYKELYKHWWRIMKTSKEQIKKGVKTTPFNEFMNQIINHFFT